MHHIYAKIETNFFHDARFRTFTAGEKVAYLAVWLLAVETSTDVLSAVASTSTYLGHRAGVSPNSVRSMVDKASTFPQPLLERLPDGGLKVCGVRKFHPKLINHGIDREEKRREYKEEEKRREEEDEPQKTLSATPSQIQDQEQAEELWTRYHDVPTMEIKNALHIMLSQGNLESVLFAIHESGRRPRSIPLAYARKVFNDTYLKTQA